MAERIRTEPYTGTRRVIEAVTCDRCRKEILGDPHGGTHAIRGGRFEVFFGWLSEYDGDSWTGQMCDECAVWFAANFSTADGLPVRLGGENV